MMCNALRVQRKWQSATLLPGSQGVSMPSFTLIGPKTMGAKGIYTHMDKTHSPPLIIQMFTYFLGYKRNLDISFQRPLNKIAVAFVTVWVQHNHHFPLPQKSVHFQKFHIIYTNNWDLWSNISTQFHQNPTHSIQDISVKKKATQTDTHQQSVFKLDRIYVICKSYT